MRDRRAGSNVWRRLEDNRGQARARRSGQGWQRSAEALRGAMGLSHLRRAHEDPLDDAER